MFLLSSSLLLQHILLGLHSSFGCQEDHEEKVVGCAAGLVQFKARRQEDALSLFHLIEAQKR
jgi:hypothetical protein